jgi:uncharacterized protein Smg (DUF494 family)
LYCRGDQQEETARWPAGAKGSPQGGPEGGILDEHMMNLFSLIANEVRNRQELFDHEDRIMQALLKSGCRIHEADAALTLMQNLVQQETENFFIPTLTSPSLRLRSMNREERDRFTVEAFGFLSKLAHIGIITEDQREELAEKAMSACNGRIDLDHIKSLIAFVLFVGPLEWEQNAASSGLRRIKKTAWN